MKRLAGKEKRSVEWLLWNVANGIVDEALKSGAGTIAIEDLKGIRARIKVAKKRRLIHHGWPFSSLFLKIERVAGKRGVKVDSVDARNTSRTCHKCGHCDKANRKSQTIFVCVRCGHKSNADFNASLNVRDRRALHGCESVTTRPRVRPSGQG
ncbi:MAG: transposase [Blastocatellia bacterium]|nr:transposase [Blastocatellia bacterium]